MALRAITASTTASNDSGDVDMKQRNPSWGYPRIAQQITLAFGIPIDRDVVRRILAARYEPTPNIGGTWLTALGHAKDSLWSVDLCRCESAVRG
jgi:hypothetical protein